MTHFQYLILADIDSGLGRFGRDSMTDQSRLEFLCEGVSMPSLFKDEDGYFKDACDWSGVSCDDLGSVTAIDWKIHPLLRGGTLDLSFLPEKLVEFGLKRQRMHGRLPAADIPRSMRVINLMDNFFAGTIDWPELPDTLAELQLDENYFSGRIDLLHMPASLEILGLSSNHFSGSIDVTGLPRGLVQLYLNDNRVSQGSIVVDNIPGVADCYIFTDNKLGEVVYASGQANPRLHF